MFSLSLCLHKYMHTYIRAHTHTYMIMLIFVFGSIFHIWEKTCDLCLSEPGVLHLTWYSPDPSIGMWLTQFHSPLWLILHCAYHIFIIHSSVVGLLGCFHSLVIVNNTTINMGM
jgi:hypothetical protein